MYWIGLTGGIACGKSTVARLLRERGFEVIDADQVARDVVAFGTDGYNEIVARFGAGILAADQSLDRSRLAQIAFSDPIRLSQLEAITHPKIKAKVAERRNEIARSGAAMAFYDVPLLFEKSMQTNFDRVITVACSLEHQMRRLRERNGLNDTEIAKRLAAQWPLEEKVRRSDAVIQNDGTLDELSLQVNLVMGRIGVSLQGHEPITQRAARHQGET
jgi:dephospho-CoA kinase